MVGRAFRICRWTDLALGVAVFAAGLWLGGYLLPALGAYLLALSAVFGAAGNKKTAAVQGALTLLVSAWAGVLALLYTTRVSRYAADTSPLSAVIVTALCLLAQAFLTLLTEDEPSLLPLRRELIASAAICGIAFAGIVLTYALGRHYAEGAAAVALTLTGCRSILITFTAKQNPLTEETYV